MKAGAVEELDKCDVYSAGVILYTLKSGGVLPHLEEEQVCGCNFLKLLEEDSKTFWLKHCIIEGVCLNKYSVSFKNLIEGMLKSNPKDRFSIKQVKQSEWYRGSIYSDQ